MRESTVCDLLTFYPGQENLFDDAGLEGLGQLHTDCPGDGDQCRGLATHVSDRLCTAGTVITSSSHRHTDLLLHALLSPHGRHYLGLGLLGDHVQPGGAHLHVVNVRALGADSLGDGVALLLVLDDEAVVEVLLATVRGEGGDTHLPSPLHVVQPTLRLVSLSTRLLLSHGRPVVLVLVELVMDEWSRSGVVLERLGGRRMGMWGLAMTNTCVTSSPHTVRGSVVVLSLCSQIESADHENLEHDDLTQAWLHYHLSPVVGTWLLGIQGTTVRPG